MCNWGKKKPGIWRIWFRKKFFFLQEKLKIHARLCLVAKEIFGESRSPLNCNLDNLSKDNQELTVTLIKLAFLIAKGFSVPGFQSEYLAGRSGMRL